MKLILSAGLERSGSTLQFNIIRVILSQYFGNDNLFSCSILEYDPEDSRPNHLVKLHQFDRELADKADFIFTSVRPKQGVINSINRINEWDKVLNVNMVDDYLDNWLNWATMADFIQSYKMINNLNWLIGIYLNILNIDTNILNVIQQLNSEMVDPGKDQPHHDPITLLHHNHRSNGN